LPRFDLNLRSYGQLFVLVFLLPENDLFEAIYEFIGIEKEYDTKDIN
jgi:hypothetical protein